MVKSRTTPRSGHRPGFTLVELLIVIAVIAVLAALLLPSIGRGVNNTRNASVKTEISQLDTAIAAFKNTHGIEPPSSITLYETGTDWNGTTANTIASRAVIQSMWPQFDFTKNRDLDNNGTATTNQSFTLSPGECLVLFLGGMYTKDATTGLFQMIGFSKDPTDPLAPFVAGQLREAPLFQFDSNRLCDVQPGGVANGIPEYLDSLPSQKKPYLYYSSYEGVGYAETSTVEFDANNVYLLATPYWQGADFSSTRWKNTSHQIISPGYDGHYGYGGPYVGTGTTPFPTATGTPTAGTSPLPTATKRAPEADNITNFSSGGVLAP